MYILFGNFIALSIQRITVYSSGKLILNRSYGPLTVITLVQLTDPLTEASAFSVIVPGMLEPLGVPIVIVSVQPLGRSVDVIVTDAIAHEPVLVTVMGNVFTPICS
jgi:hypothetical protein